MKNLSAKRWNKYLIGLLIIAFLAAGVMISRDMALQAEDQKTIDEVFSFVGPFISAHPEYLSQSLQSLEGGSMTPDDVVAWVNEIPITIGELEQRKGLNEKAGIGEQGYQEVFNKLVQEKVILHYALQKKVLPSKDEVASFISQEQADYQNEGEFKQIVDSFCEYANMSLDDYWNTFEKYNAFRLLVFSNSYKHSILEAEKSGKIDFAENMDASEKQKIKEEYWKDIVSNLKANAEIKINEKFKALVTSS